MAPLAIEMVLLGGDEVLPTGFGGATQTALGGSSDSARRSATPLFCCTDELASFQFDRFTSRTNNAGTNGNLNGNPSRRPLGIECDGRQA